MGERKRWEARPGEARGGREVRVFTQSAGGISSSQSARPARGK